MSPEWWALSMLMDAEEGIYYDLYSMVLISLNRSEGLQLYSDLLDVMTHSVPSD